MKLICECKVQKLVFELKIKAAFDITEQLDYSEKIIHLERTIIKSKINCLEQIPTFTAFLLSLDLISNSRLKLFSHFIERRVQSLLIKNTLETSARNVWNMSLDFLEIRRWVIEFRRNLKRFMQIGQMCPNLAETEKQAYNKIANEKYYTKILRESNEILFAVVTLNYKKL